MDECRARPPGCSRHSNPGTRAFAAIREAFTELGNPFTSTAYMRWRTRQTEADNKARRYGRIPGYCAIWARYGTWSNACTAALANWKPDKAA